MAGTVSTHVEKSFAGEITKRDHIHKRVTILHEDYYQTEINKFQIGEKVTIKITSEKPKRTEAQNRYYWGAYLPMISESTGEHELEALHNLFKGKFLTKEVKEVLGQKVRVTKSTTELTKAEFVEYIMNIEQLTGVQAPPTDGYWD